MKILISWLLMKPADLDLHCFSKEDMFVLILYIPVNNFSVVSGTGLPGLNQY